MKNAAAKLKLAKLFALLGAVILWFPLLFAAAAAVIGSAAEKRLLFDWLLPAELFPAAVLGAIMLIIGAYISRRFCKFICLVSLLMAVFLVAGQLTAVLTGLASGKIAAEGAVFNLVAALIAAYTLLLLADCIAGVKLTFALYKTND